MRQARLVVLVSLFSLALAAPAGAATPFTIGLGFGPDVAVAPDGVGHAAYLSDSTEEGSSVTYCRVQPGASDCDAAEQVLEFPHGPAEDPNSQSDQVQVFAPTADKIVIFASCFVCNGSGATDQSFRWISTNGGDTFGSGPTLVGEIQLEGRSTYVNTGSQGILLGTNGPDFQAMPFNPLIDELDLGQSYDGATGVLENFDKAVHVSHLLDAADGVVRVAVFTDPTPASIADQQGELNNIANWDTGNLLPGAEADNSQTSLTSGPGGIWLSYHYEIPLDSRTAMRKFDPATDNFGPPVYVEGNSKIENTTLSHTYSEQDPSGGLHVIWDSNYDSGRLRYVKSTDGGATWSAPLNLAQGESFDETRLDVNPTGAGLLTWVDAAGGDVNDPIRIVPVDPYVDPADIPTPPPGDVPGNPTITNPTIDDNTLTPGQKTVFNFRVNEPGNAVLTFERRFNGKKGKRKGKKVCLPISKKKFGKLKLKKKKRCKGWKKVGSISQQVQAGQNQIPFSGRIAGRKLSKGQYRARLVITDLAGNLSRTETIKFKVVVKKKKKKR